MIFLGMDVHVRNSFLHAVDSDGKVLARGRVGNSLAEMAEFLGRLDGQEVSAVLECTTNSRAVQRLVCQAGSDSGRQVSARVLDARKLRVIAESVRKCDTLDAAVLTELARSNLKLPECYVPDDEVFALREHLRGRADLVRIRTMLKNRVSSLLHRRGILSPLKDLYTKDGRAYLLELKLDEAGRALLDRLLGLVEDLGEAVEQSTGELRKLSRTDRWYKPVALLQTMPGVGLITAMTILAELGDVNRFHGRSSVSNYAGLVPVMRSSNDKRWSGGITHRGSAHLRRVMVEAAWMAVGRVPQYAAMYSSVSGRRGKQVAIVAVARRMLEDGWTMLRKGQVFRMKSEKMDERIVRELEATCRDESSVQGESGERVGPGKAG